MNRDLRSLLGQIQTTPGDSALYSLLRDLYLDLDDQKSLEYLDKSLSLCEQHSDYLRRFYRHDWATLGTWSKQGWVLVRVKNHFYPAIPGVSYDLRSQYQAVYQAVYQVVPDGEHWAWKIVNILSASQDPYFSWREVAFLLDVSSDEKPFLDDLLKPEETLVKIETSEMSVQNKKTLYFTRDEDTWIPCQEVSHRRISQ